MVGISAAVADVRTSTVDMPSSDSASDTLAALLPEGRGYVLVIFLTPPVGGATPGGGAAASLRVGSPPR